MTDGVPKAALSAGLPRPRSMLGTIFAFEVRYHLRRPSTYFLTVALFAAAVFIASRAPAALRPPLVHANSPYVVMRLVTLLIAVGQVVTPGIAGMATLRDARFLTRELLLACPLGRLDYLAGRFLGAVTISLVMYAAIPLGVAAGAFMPWVDPSTLGAFSPLLYVHAWLVAVVPTVFVLSAIFFAVGALTRNEPLVYAQGVGLFIAYSIASTLASSAGGLAALRPAALLDVFGFTTFDYATRYWTVAEKNTRVLALGGIVLENRLLWFAIAIAALALAYARFSRAPQARSFRPGARRSPDATPAENEVAITSRPTARASASATTSAGAASLAPRAPAAVAQLASIVRFSFAGIIKDKAFLIVAALGVLNAALNAEVAGRWYDTPMYPVTGEVSIGMLIGSQFYFLIIAAIYAGELAWRERQMRASELVDALPVSTAIAMTGKLLGLIAAEAALLLVFLLAGIAVQTANSYHHFELGVYLRFLYGVQFPAVVAVTLLAFAVHSVVNQKYVGHLVLVAWFVATESLRSLGLEHQLWRFGHWAPFAYSAMNRFGGFVANLAWLAACWLTVGALLGVVAYLFWVRGRDTRWRARLGRARARLTPRAGAAGGLATAGALCCGGFILYNTNVLNTYRTVRQRRAMAARYETSYRRYFALPRPRLAGVQLRVDLYPERRAFDCTGVQTYVNGAARPLDTLFVQMGDELGVDSLVWSQPATRYVADSAQGVFIYTLAQSLAPGDSLRLAYGDHYGARGFPNATPHTTIAANGTDLNPDIVHCEPTLGYQRAAELSDARDRKTEHLPPRARSLPITTPPAERYDDMDGWSTMDEIVSTAPDQIAIAPGPLVREWTERGRRFFHYHAYGPVLAGAATVLSARYAVRTDAWRAPDGRTIPIQIFYHPAHPYNVRRLISAVERSLAYDTDNFGPYQFRQFRMVEVPNDSSYAAASGPNTILFTERAGFLMHVTDAANDLDMPTYVTAHEVSHQWWAHQVVAARVQGGRMLSESLAEYSALMVMEHEYGRYAVRKFLLHELDRYLAGRARETVREMPLALAEDGQPYIYYFKGALAFYALRDYLGEGRVNAVLRAFVKQHRFQGPPFPTSQDLVNEFRAVTPDSLQQAITDLFETITLWDFRTLEASATRRVDGRYDVRLVLSARKLRADTLGDQTAVPPDDYVDVGVFGAPEGGNALGAPLYLHKYHVTAPRMTVTVTVDGKPERAGLDPYNKLIDRNPDDNVRAVEVKP